MLYGQWWTLWAIVSSFIWGGAAARQEMAGIGFVVNTILMVVSVIFSWALLRRPVEQSALLHGPVAAGATSYP